MYQEHKINIKINIIKYIYKKKSSNKKSNTTLLVEHSNFFSMLIDINIK